MKGNRKLLVFFGAGLMLFGALALCLFAPSGPAIGVALFGTFASGVATASGIFTWGNAQEHKHAAGAPPAAS